MDLDNRISIPSEVLYQKVGEELVLLHLGSGVYFGLDPIGSRMWELLASGKSVGEMMANVEAEYDVTTEQLRQDVERLLGELREKALISFEKE